MLNKINAVLMQSTAIVVDNQIIIIITVEAIDKM